MNKLYCLVGLSIAGILAGCNSDIVTTDTLKMLEHECVYVAPLQSDDPHVGQVVKDVLEKELMRKQVNLCDPNTATILFSGSTFMTVRGSGSTSSQAIESVSLVGKSQDGEMLMSASYDNVDRYSASKLAQEFGAKLANKLK